MTCCRRFLSRSIIVSLGVVVSLGIAGYMYASSVMLLCLNFSLLLGIGVLVFLRVTLSGSKSQIISFLASVLLDNQNHLSFASARRCGAFDNQKAMFV